MIITKLLTKTTLLQTQIASSLDCTHAYNKHTPKSAISMAFTLGVICLTHNGNMAPTSCKKWQTSVHLYRHVCACECVHMHARTLTQLTFETLYRRVCACECVHMHARTLTQLTFETSVKSKM